MDIRDRRVFNPDDELDFLKRNLRDPSVSEVGYKEAIKKAWLDTNKRGRFPPAPVFDTPGQNALIGNVINLPDLRGYPRDIEVLRSSTVNSQKSGIIEMLKNRMKTSQEDPSMQYDVVAPEGSQATSMVDMIRSLKNKLKKKLKKK
jgi:hypothetical protein